MITQKTLRLTLQSLSEHRRLVWDPTAAARGCLTEQTGRESERISPSVAHTPTMRVTFLGTSGAVPTTERNTSAVMMAREGDRLLFDCGEGTQRQMMRYAAGFDVEHVFLTHLHGDHVLGLPGLVQTWDFNDRESPLSIHAPAGTRSQVERLVSATGTRPSYPVRIHQVEPDDVALDRAEFEVRAVEVDHRTTAVGYALVEDDRKGRFDRETAEEEFGIPPGPKYSRLHEGEPVEHDGRVVRPEEVVGPPRPGRRLVYTGDTRPCGGVVEAAEGADLLIHDATFADDWTDRARQTAHATAREAAAVANRAGARRLALTHVSSRYAGDGWRQLAAQAREVFDGDRAFVARDGTVAEVPFRDSDREFGLSSAD
jgi:ribonuclease Z